MTDKPNPGEAFPPVVRKLGDDLGNLGKVLQGENVPKKAQGPKITIHPDGTTTIEQVPE